MTDANFTMTNGTATVTFSEYRGIIEVATEVNGQFKGSFRSHQVEVDAAREDIRNGSWWLID